MVNHAAATMTNSAINAMCRRIRNLSFRRCDHGTASNNGQSRRIPVRFEVMAQMSSKEQSERYQLFQNLLSNFPNLLTDYRSHLSFTEANEGFWTLVIFAFFCKNSIGKAALGLIH